MGKRLFVFCLLVMLTLTGCSKVGTEEKTGDSTESDKIQIGICFDSFVIERWQRDRDVFVSTAKELGAEVNVQNAYGDVEKQRNQIDYFIKKGMDVKAEYPEIGAPDTMDAEGRMITIELPEYYFNLVYTPNAGDGLKRLALRQVWDQKYAEYLSSLDQKKPVISCGDYNVAHEEIDLANPDSNHESAGFTDEEREGFTNLLNKGFVDTFRYVHGNVEGAYSWWAQRIRTSKINNAGWRIDYFLVSERIKDKVTRSEMLDSGTRQDHAPIVLELK